MNTSYLTANDKNTITTGHEWFPLLEYFFLVNWWMPCRFTKIIFSPFSLEETFFIFTCYVAKSGKPRKCFQCIQSVTCAMLYKWLMYVQQDIQRMMTSQLSSVFKINKFAWVPLISGHKFQVECDSGRGVSKKNKNKTNAWRTTFTHQIY